MVPTSNLAAREVVKSPARELGLEDHAATVELGRPLLDVKAAPSAHASTT